MLTDALSEVENVLRDWGAWLRGGSDGAGWPSVNVLHRSWMPPAPGMRPGMKVGRRAEASVAELHERVREMPMRLRNTLVVVYVQVLSPAEQADRLQCSESTVRARVQEAKRLLVRGEA